MTNRFKFRVWDKVTKRYFFLELKFGDNGYHPQFIEKPQFEQCTGLKDKNGKLIYENDVVEIMVWDSIEEDMVETKGKVYWSKEDASFLIYVSFDGEYPLYGQEIKVIGNIHENADLLE